MKLYENKEYIEDLEYISDSDLPWGMLQNKSLLISGATGLVGSCLIDAIMKRNDAGLNCKIYALGRNKIKASERFAYCIDSDLFEFHTCDVSMPFEIKNVGDIDYVFHLASNTHPLQYATDPIGTITTNVFGTYNMLQFATRHNAIRCLFTSSNEVYGENRGDVELFDERYCGYIDSNTMRAGYPESKRCCESICQAFIKQKNMDIVIPRLTRSYGPTMLMSDTKAISQFIKKGVIGQDIVLKSSGTQYYSYAYVADTVFGLLTILLKGVCGEAYNVSDATSDIMLKDLASIIAEITGKNVVLETPNEVEVAGYSNATKARLDGSKLKKLGWKPRYDIRTGVKRTIQILKEIDNNLQDAN